MSVTCDGHTKHVFGFVIEIRFLVVLFEGWYSFSSLILLWKFIDFLQDFHEHHSEKKHQKENSHHYRIKRVAINLSYNAEFAFWILYSHYLFKLRENFQYFAFVCWDFTSLDFRCVANNVCYFKGLFDLAHCSDGMNCCLSACAQ
jgi:hypothetical protein